jgi:hypothetical protein
MEVEFLYWSNPPDIVDPTARIADPSAYRTIVALSRAALTNSLGIELGNRAVPVAWDPSGKPVVWAVTP